MHRNIRRAAIVGLPAIALVGLALATRPAEDAPAAPGEPEGGRYFFCAMGQTLKYIGLFTGNVSLVVAGAIGGGIACGMGW